MISDEKAIELANQYVDELRKKSLSKNGKTKLLFYRNGSCFNSCIVNSTRRELDYLACTLAKENNCRVKVCRKETYL